MTKYFWDDNSLLMDRNTIVEIVNSTTDPYLKNELTSVISFLDNYHFINSSGAPSPNFRIRDRIYFTASERTGYQSAYFLIHNFHKLLSPLINKFESNSNDLNDILGDEEDFSNLLGIHISNDDALTYLDKFYKEFDKELYEYFKITFEKKEKQLRFSNDNNHKSSNLDSDGFCLYVGGLNKNYISVNDDDHASKYFNLVHEFGHSIANHMNPKACYNEKETFYCEVQSMFPEMVALYENQINIPQVEINHLLYSLMLTNFDASNYLTMHDILINEWEDNKYKVNLSLYYKLKKNYGINKKTLLASLNHSITDSGTYVASYIICCELIDIYKQDKEKAIDIYKKILMIPYYENEFAAMEKIVTPNINSLKISEEISDRLSLSLRKM